MDILLPGATTKRRIPDLEFDGSGPKVGTSTLLSKSALGFVVRPEAADLLEVRVQGAFDARHLRKRLEAVARALNAGDLALAAIATSQLRLR